MRSFPKILLPTLLCRPAFAGSALDAAGSTLTMLLGLAVVLAALYGSLLLLKKVQQKTGTAQARVQVIGATAIGPRERVVLVEIAERVLVLGVAPGRITRLDSLDASAVPRTPPSPPPTLNDFQTKLAEVLKGVRRDR